MKLRSGFCQNPECRWLGECPVLLPEHMIPKWHFKAGLAKGDPTDPSNIEWWCPTCARIKTRAEQRTDEYREYVRTWGTGRRHHADSIEKVRASALAREARWRVSGVRHD